MAIRFIIQTISTFYCFWITAGADTSNCTVFDLDGKNRNNVFECKLPGIISCKVAANSFLLQWFIAETIVSSTSVAAQCSGTTCTPFNDFSGRYTYTHNPADGIANITIRNISSDDRGLKYKFNDGTLPQIFEPITKVFPDQITTNINLIDGTQNVAVSTDCTLLSKNITFVWKKTKNSSGAQLEPLTQDDVKHTEITNLYDTLCDSTHTCGRIIFSSTLMFIPGNSGDAYYLHCTVVVNDENGPPNKTWISSKAYQFNKTETTTLSTVTLTPTPTNVITSTTSSVITPTQTVVISPTPTNVVSSTSAIVVASSSTEKTPPDTKQNLPSTERYKSVIIASSTGGVILLIIIISACVCYKKRKKRTEIKVRKNTFSKEDTNLQENKL